MSIVWYCQICNTTYTGAKANCLCNGPNYESSYIAAEAKRVDEALRATQKELTKNAWFTIPYKRPIKPRSEIYGFEKPKVTNPEFLAALKRQGGWKVIGSKPECDCYDRACHDGHAYWCSTRSK